MKINYLNIEYEGTKDNVHRTYLIQNTISKQFVRLGMNETYYLLTVLKVQDQSDELLMEQPQELSDDLKKILDKKFVQWGFLNQDRIGVKIRKNEGLKKIHVFSFNVEKVLKYIYPIYSKVFTKPFFILTIAMFLGIIGYVAYVISYIVPEKSSWVTSRIALEFNLKDIIIVILFALLNTIFHEFAHAVTCIKYGGKVSTMGLMLFYFIPCFYCDVSSVYTFRDRKQRALVASAGIIINFFVGELALIIGLVMAHFGIFNMSLFYMSIFSMFIAVYNLIPFVKLDGYWILQAIIGVDNLMDKSIVLSYVTIFQNSRVKELCIRKSKRILLSFYGVLSMLFHPVFWGGALTSLISFMNLEGRMMIAAYCGVVVIIFLDLIKSIKYYVEIITKEFDRYLATM